MTDVPHPWRELRKRPHLTLHIGGLTGRRWGAIAGDTIWIRTGLLQVERRCTLAHELEHHKRGHDGCQPEAVERAVRHAAARYLAPSPHAVADALVWAGGHLGTAADELWLDVATMAARLDGRHLHPAERAIIVGRLTDEGVTIREHS